MGFIYEARGGLAIFPGKEVVILPKFYWRREVRAYGQQGFAAGNRYFDCTCRDYMLCPKSVLAARLAPNG